MDKKLNIYPHTSVSKEVLPFVASRLNPRDGCGWALVHFEKDDMLEMDILSISAVIGASFFRCLAYHFLSSVSGEKLVAHVEGISSSHGITPVFVLGCITPTEVGGETRVFDARLAARLVKGKYPEFAQVELRYSSLANPDEQATYQLIETNKTGDQVLRYRSQVATNEILNLKGTNSQEFYQTIDGILEECVLISYQWKRGDVLFVNNEITLHDRLAFIGQRTMIRIRFDDKLNQRISY